MYGSLLCLSHDGFKTLLWATVANRDLSLLVSKRQIDIRFPSGFEADFKLDRTYTMVESVSTYYEAYQHVLAAIQRLDPETLPFKDYIIQCKKDVAWVEIVSGLCNEANVKHLGHLHTWSRVVTTRTALIMCSRMGREISRSWASGQHSIKSKLQWTNRRWTRSNKLWRKNLQLCKALLVPARWASTKARYLNIILTSCRPLLAWRSCVRY